MTARNGNARLAPGVDEAADLTHATAKPTGGRPEAQGNRLQRNACQLGRRDLPPAGADAAADLTRALAGWTALLGKTPIDPTKATERRNGDQPAEAPRVVTEPDPIAGKQAAMALYCYCGVSLESTATSFARHPNWRSA
jgi:hypothetical protein